MKTFLALLVLLTPGMLLAENPGHPTPPASPELPDGSLYALTSIWTNQDGKKVAWNKASGKARVLAMGYSTCKGICPRIIADMQRIEAKLTPEEREQTTFTFLSVAPETDGIPELKALIANHKLNNETWQVMKSEPDNVLEMAVALGIQYTLLPNGVDYAHSYLVVVVSPDGKLLHKWADPAEGPERSLHALRAALKSSQ